MGLAVDCQVVGRAAEGGNVAVDPINCQVLEGMSVVV